MLSYTGTSDKIMLVILGTVKNMCRNAGKW